MDIVLMDHEPEMNISCVILSAADRKMLIDAMHNVVREACLTSESHDSEEKLFVDVLNDLGISEVAKSSDLMSAYIGGTHTTASCELPLEISQFSFILS